jgi:hypothetical protein
MWLPSCAIRSAQPNRLRDCVLAPDAWPSGPAASGGSLQANDAQQRLIIDERHEFGDADLAAQAHQGFLEHALMDPTDHLTMFSGNDLEWTTVKLDFVLTR